MKLKLQSKCFCSCFFFRKWASEGFLFLNLTHEKGKAWNKGECSQFNYWLVWVLVFFVVVVNDSFKPNWNLNLTSRDWLFLGFKNKFFNIWLLFIIIFNYYISIKSFLSYINPKKRSIMEINCENIILQILKQLSPFKWNVFSMFHYLEPPSSGFGVKLTETES